MTDDNYLAIKAQLKAIKTDIANIKKAAMTGEVLEFCSQTCNKLIAVEKEQLEIRKRLGMPYGVKGYQEQINSLSNKLSLQIKIQHEYKKKIRGEVKAIQVRLDKLSQRKSFFGKIKEKIIAVYNKIKNAARIQSIQ